MNIKQEILKVLKPVFNESIIEFIEKYYDDENPEELVDLAKELLLKKVGEEQANLLMKNITEFIENGD